MHHSELIRFIEQEAPQLAPRSQSIKKLKSFLVKYTTEKLYVSADIDVEVKQAHGDESVTEGNVVEVSRPASEHYSALQIRLSFPEEPH